MTHLVRLTLPGFLLISISLLLSGCSAYMAANQPGKKDFNVLKPGTARSVVIAELGKPLTTEMQGGHKVDIFKFTQGYGAGVRAGRAIVHGAASVATLGLWEVIGTPVEGHFNGTELSIEVHYNMQDQVIRVVPLKGQEEINRNMADTAKAPPKPPVKEGY